ncbi:hypothetical protein EXIGLDRAFT_141322 [Exidia glandulosa HHB12029]|uniref:Uncharacterized protein n=1 Tax=Exidia glandulosa HHB12029 TaxID=1314781 RepID=A0A165FV97_EXIGL|nr:hypothetical protein EXIGLDRAFT_141322 [Exidia glandulosa HHB12029]
MTTAQATCGPERRSGAVPAVTERAREYCTGISIRHCGDPCRALQWLSSSALMRLTDAHNRHYSYYALATLCTDVVEGPNNIVGPHFVSRQSVTRRLANTYNSMRTRANSTIAGSLVRANSRFPRLAALRFELRSPRLSTRSSLERHVPANLFPVLGCRIF